MLVVRTLRVLFLVMAATAYLANGAQAHLKISQGETLELMLCSTGAERAVKMHLPGEPAQETEDTCCGDCAPSPAILYASLRTADIALRHVIVTLHSMPTRVHPRSPLWPGAPPNGPPHILKANT
ncbi:MAG: hypothetical protein AAFW60_06220 [Pseudomonadota bacterium]